MNLDKLKQAEADFLTRYPGGFFHPEWASVGKKHKMDKMIGLANACFSKKQFSDIEACSQDMVKVINRSSMVSLFEKPKFRDWIKSANSDELKAITCGLKQFLYDKQQKGFDSLVNTLLPYKLAKWSLITIIPNYVFPNDEVFVKPTTAKGVINHFELQGLNYRPQANWEFYQHYREQILTMKGHVATELKPNNAAFCGFLMVAVKMQEALNPA